jgi:hypothetical protein
MRCPATITRVFAAALLLAAARLQSAHAPSAPVVWRLETTSQIGGHPTTSLGAPVSVNEDGQKALRFNGESDGLIVAQNPLKGLAAFTIEVRFKPDGGGPAAQRFVHLEDTAENRALIETRVTPERQWYLDTFLFSKPAENGVTLADKTKLHPCDQWFWAALVYDGKMMSHFVDAQKELEGSLAFGPMVDGRTSLGVRLNQVFWFKGAIAEVRFHPRAVPVRELQRMR